MHSDQIVAALNAWRDLRDSSTERLFMDVYGQPLLQAAVGLYGDAHVHRRRPGAEPEHRRFLARRREELGERIAQGGAHEAIMRSLIYVLGGAPSTDERNFKQLRATRTKLESDIELCEFKRLVREQFFILKLDRERALNTLPELLAGESNSAIDGYIKNLEQVFAASGELTEHAAERFVQVKALFDKARPAKPAVKKTAVNKATTVESPPGEAKKTDTPVSQGKGPRKR
ncbi:DUF3141 domain-containing protein [Halomonas hibernica]|uniref:DUF3141 domain-containing protein n=1 Tax=Halomonas hibernica TaxID=2591147 RepID=UPI003872C02B